MNPIHTLVYKGETQDITTMPHKLLIWVFLHWGALSADLLKAIAQEIRRRPEIVMSPYLRAKVNAVDPPPCQCGGPGLYIVGGQTYCRRCHPYAKARLMDYRTRVLDVRQGLVEQDTADYNRAVRSAEHHKRVDPKRARKPKK